MVSVSCLKCNPLKNLYKNKVYLKFTFKIVENAYPTKFYRLKPIEIDFQVHVTGTPKADFENEKYIIILYLLYTILYTESQILYSIPSCAIGNSNLGAGGMQPPPKCSFNIKNWIIILYSFCIILYTESQFCTPFPLALSAI